LWRVTLTPPTPTGTQLYRRGSDGEQFVRYVQNVFLIHNVDNPTREGVIRDLVLCNEPGLVIDLPVGEHFALRP